MRHPIVAAVETTAGCTDMPISCIVICMRTTLILDRELIARAQDLTGIAEKTAVVHEGLRALIARESARRLAALGGFDRRAAAAPRRRPAAK